MNVEDAIAETMQKQNNAALGQQRIIPTPMQQHQHQYQSKSQSDNSSHFVSSSPSSLLGHHPGHDVYNAHEDQGHGKSSAAVAADHLSLPMLSPVAATEEDHRSSGGITSAAVSLCAYCAAWSSSLLSSLVACSSYDAALAVSFFFLWLAVGVIWTQVHTYMKSHDVTTPTITFMPTHMP